jgi:antitoxin PrlF
MPKSMRKKPVADDKGACCGADCCGSAAGCCGLPSPGCCQVEAVVSVDARGQMVLPKEVREQFGIRAEDKLAVVSWTRAGEPCCLTLLKAGELADAVRQTYGPVLREIVSK